MKQLHIKFGFTMFTFDLYDELKDWTSDIFSNEDIVYKNPIYNLETITEGWIYCIDQCLCREEGFSNDEKYHF